MSSEKENDDFEQFRGELGRYRTVTILVDVADSSIQIHHDGMNQFEALGILTTAVQLASSDVMMFDDDEEDEDDERRGDSGR